MALAPWKRKILKGFGAAQRPVAWTILGGGFISFFAVLFNIVATGDAKIATLFATILTMNDGFQAVQEVENELEEGGEVDS